MSAREKGVFEAFDLGAMPLYLTLTATAPTYQMKPGDHCVCAVSSADDGAGIVTLPAKGEAAGKFYFIYAPTGATAGDISLYDKETGAEITTIGDMDADDDYLLLFCDGRNWRAVLEGVA